jgi:phenylpyruvate tautomerase PptA (4-oxalocrotonate tautomerase family)
VQVLTNAGALDRDKQLAVVRQFTDMVATAAGDASLSNRTWVLLTEAVEGGWGLAGHANTNAELIETARTKIARHEGYCAVRVIAALLAGSLVRRPRN